MGNTYIIKNDFGEYYTGHESDGLPTLSWSQKDAMRFNMQHPERKLFADRFPDVLSEKALPNKRWAKETALELLNRGIMSTARTVKLVPKETVPDTVAMATVKG